MPTLHVLCNKETLDPERLRDHVVIVLDILFATTTIVHAFSEGVESVWPALNQDDANAIAQGIPHCVRAGEHLADTLPGFASAAPLLLACESLRGKSLVYCTTNGTVALRRASRAAHVYPGALLNGAALVAHILREHPLAPVLVVCSGSIGRFNLEDFYGAGHLVAHFQKESAYELNDAALAAKLLRDACQPYATLLSSRVGRMMQARSLEHEVEYASQRDIVDVVARLQDGCLRRVR